MSSPDDFFFNAFQKAAFRRMPHKCTGCGQPVAQPGARCASCLSADMMNDGRMGNTFYTDTNTFPYEQYARMRDMDEILRNAQQAARENSWREQQDRMNREQSRAFAAQAQPNHDVTVTITPDMLRRLTYLCHPDKHAQSEGSNIAFKWLQSIKSGTS